MTLLQLSRHVSPIWKPRVESVRKEIRIKNVIRIYVFPLRNRVPTTYTKLYVHCRMQMLQYLWSWLKAGRWTIMIFSCFLTACGGRQGGQNYVFWYGRGCSAPWFLLGSHRIRGRWRQPLLSSFFFVSHYGDQKWYTVAYIYCTIILLPRGPFIFLEWAAECLF